MGNKGLDFKHKEVVNINDGKRLRVCSRCNIVEIIKIISIKDTQLKNLIKTLPKLSKVC